MSLRIPTHKSAHSPRRLRARGTGILPVFPALEPLESRTLLYSWTPQEVFFAELINRARANPLAEADRLGLNFATGLSQAEQALLVPHEPLALSASLTASARLHSADMAARNFFDHNNPDGLTPTTRAQNAGYSGTAGENIGAGYSTIDALYLSWMSATSERRNVLSLYTDFDASYHYDHIGPGFALDTPGAVYPSYYTADFGNPSSQTRAPWLLGVIFADADHDNFYSIGEGASAIRIDVFTGSTTTGTPAATYTTDAAGNYQLPLSNGSYTVVFTRPGDNYRVVKSAFISGQNLELSAQTSELAPPPPPPDDFANAGQWNLAATISVDPTTGSGSRTGALQSSGDTDLFTFTATKTGVTHISGLPTGASFDGLIRVYNAAHSLIATGADGTLPTDSVADVSLTAGSTYYILLSATNNTATGAYTITIDGPVTPPPPPPPPDDFANSGQWSLAAAIDIDPTSSSGSRSGSLESAADSDLFTFTAAQSGDTTLSALSTSAGLTTRLRIYDAAHNLLATGDSILTLTAGQTYFLLIDSADPTQTGAYIAQIQGPAAPPPPPPDDFANFGQWNLAAAIDINSTTGNGSRTGSIEVSSDSDLFTFIPTKSGLTTLAAVSVGGAGLQTRLRLYDANNTLIATGAPGTNPLDSILSATLTAGARYYLLIDSVDGASTGSYTATILAPTIPQQSLGASGQPVNPLWLGSGSAARPVLSFINQLGRPIVAIRSPQGVWSSTDIQQAANSPAISGDLQAWVDSRDGLLYAAATSSSGVLVFKRSSTGAWSFRNLTAEILVSHNITSNLTTFTDASGLRQIAGLDSGGHMVTYWMTGIMWPQGWRYFFTDLAARDLVRRNHAMPSITGTLTSYVTQRNSLNILGTNASGEVILFFRPGGGLATQIWNWTNLSQLTGCASLTGNITATETSGRIVNISGTDASGNLWMITWRSGEGWRSRNATSTTPGSSTLASGSVASWSNAAGAGFVAGLTSAGDIVLYRYTFTGGQNTWAYATISAAVPNAPHLTGPLRATITSAGAILISGVTSTGEAIRFTFDTAWSAESISQLLP